MNFSLFDNTDVSSGENIGDTNETHETHLQESIANKKKQNHNHNEYSIYCEKCKIYYNKKKHHCCICKRTHGLQLVA